MADDSSKAPGRSRPGASSGEKDPVLQAINDLNAKFDSLNTKFDSLSTKFDTIDTWKVSVDNRLDAAELVLKAVKDQEKAFNKASEALDLTAKGVATTQTAIERRLTDIETARDNWVSEQAVSTVRLKKSINVMDRKLRECNIRAQGIVLAANETAKEACLRVFKAVVPELEKLDMDYIVKIPPKPVKQVAGAAPVAPQPPILLIKFRNKSIRNQVFYKARKDKDSLTGKVIVRDDMSKPDHALWVLAKPQMQIAHEKGERAKFTEGTLTIESHTVPIRDEHTVWK